MMREFSMPPGYSWSFGRWNRFQQEEQQAGWFSLWMAALLVYMLMACLFESFAQPLTIMFSIPFALVGVALAMKAAGQPWDTMTTIGLILLLGLVVNNAIVLIDHINQLRKSGLSRDDAVIQGGRHRLRPIVITAVTTILGLLPLVAPVLFPQWFGPLEGRAGTWAPIGLVVLGGLTTSTLLTLLVIPTVYSLVDDASRFASRLVRSLGSRRTGLTAVVAALGLSMALVSSGCGGDAGGSSGESHGERGRGEGRSGRGHPGEGGAPPGEAAAAVPVEVGAVERTTISSYIETNGTLEAEFDVAVLARTEGPVTTLSAEEGEAVQKGQLLARIDPDQAQANLEIARVELDEARKAYDRAQSLHGDSLISDEGYQGSLARFESAQAAFEGARIVLGYAEIRAPFSGVVVTRHVKLAQNVRAGDRLFRIVDFDPLLCRIQIPEKELSRLSVGQSARLTVEPWPDQEFSARVLRISPVVDAETGTIRVTLEAEGEGKLRPGMFANVFLATEAHEGALVIPRRALAAGSISDVVYVVVDATAARREVTLGVRERDRVEVIDGLAEGETIVVVGQDGLSDGTPIEIFDPDAPPAPTERPGETAGPSRSEGKRGEGSSRHDRQP